VKRALAIAALLMAASCAFAEEPVDLVRKSVDLEIKAAQDYTTPYTYVLRKESNSGVAVRQMVETKDGLLLARTLTWNGKVPSSEDQAKEDRRLERLITSAEERSKKAAEQKDDAQRALRILRALPTSSLYTLDGHENIAGRDTIRLAFKPNPKFSPEVKETYLLKAAEGKMWIDAESTRMVRLDATITDSVSIGWGLLGKIDKGGKLFLEQAIVKGGQWRMTALRIDATGKALIFKSIRIKQHQTGSNYEPIKPVSVAEAVELLKRSAQTTAADVSGQR
jgi:hypothetical protein